MDIKKLALGLGITVSLWFLLRWLGPVLLPFAMGGLLALAAEPVVSLGRRYLHMPRALASALGVLLTVGLLAGILLSLGAVLIGQVGRLSSVIPSLESGAAAVEDFLIAAADRAPEGVRTVAQRTVLSFFDDGTALMRQVTDRLPGVVTSVLSGVGSGFLGIGTAVLSGYLISVRLPKLRLQVKNAMPPAWQETWLPSLKKVKGALGGWFKAQGTLALITWGIVFLGFFLLKIPYALMWAALVALVDAVPILGTGIVLLPWALVSFLQNNGLQAVGLLCIYLVAVITRTVLEPRLVGKNLGLDPLVTLIALYGGLRLWGIPGLLLAPILASAAKALLTKPDP